MLFDNVNELVNFLESDKGGIKFDVVSIDVKTVKIAGAREPGRQYCDFTSITLTAHGYDAKLTLDKVFSSRTNTISCNFDDETEMKNALLKHLDYLQDDLNGADFDIYRIDELPQIAIHGIYQYGK